MEETIDRRRGSVPGQAVSALKHRNYQLFFAGQSVSLIGTWMQNIAQSWLVLELTNSALLLGVVSTMQFLPMLFFSLVAGEVADRFPKRTLLILTQSSMMIYAVALGLLTITGHVRYWHVVLLAGLLGTSNAFDNPTRQAFIVEMVGKADLMNAITLNSSMVNGARVVGPALAGLAIGKLGLAPCFLLNAASFLAVLVSLFLMRINNEPSNQRPASNMMWQNITEGLHYITKTPVILNAILLMAFLNVFAMNNNVLVPLLARTTLHQQAEGYGFLAASSGIGALLGGMFLAARSDRGPQRKLMLVGGAGLCFFQLLLAFSRQFYLSLFLLFLAGLAMNIFVPLINTTVQMNVKDHLRARVMSVYTIVFLGLTPFGSLLSGSVAHFWSTPAALAVGATLGLLAMVLLLIRERQQQLHVTAED
ncbi:MAG TPA: MFS transporter [Syntrophomonadaceae bacterium]|nr:MFS transporter [Syntrophomonadaceae bacterium]